MQPRFPVRGKFFFCAFRPYTLLARRAGQCASLARSSTTLTSRPTPTIAIAWPASRSMETASASGGANRRLLLGLVIATCLVILLYNPNAPFADPLYHHNVSLRHGSESETTNRPTPLTSAGWPLGCAEAGRPRFLCPKKGRGTSSELGERPNSTAGLNIAPVS